MRYTDPGSIVREIPLFGDVQGALDVLARNMRIMWAGGLADMRSLVGAQGRYSVQVQEPLYISEDGVGINLDSPTLVQRISQNTWPSGENGDILYHNGTAWTTLSGPASDGTFWLKCVRSDAGGTYTFSWVEGEEFACP